MLVDGVLTLLKDGTNDSQFALGAFDPSRLKSNKTTYLSNPKTPLERIVASQISATDSVKRFVAARPYGKSILVTYTSSQEPGIPSYSITKISQDGDSLYAKSDSTIFDLKSLNVVYGVSFYY